MPKRLIIGGKTVKSIETGQKNVKSISIGGVVVWEASQPDYFFIENYTQSANTVAFPKNGSADEWVSLDYSLDGSTWSSFDLETGVSIPAGGKLYLKGDNANLSKSASSVWTTHSFTSTGAILAGGNAVSLLDSTAPATKSVGQFGFACMFAGNTNLLSVDSAMFDGVGLAASYVFYKTFDGCTNLTNVPVFRGVTNVTQSSFTQTFRNCSSVTTAAGFLPNAVSTTSTLVFQSCFANCTGLVTPPDLSAIVPGAGNSVFIEMFRGCTSLAIPAEVYSPVPNVTGTHKLAGMYNGCTSLTRSPRVYIPNPTANILLNTFTGCGSLDLIRVTFDSWGTDGEYTNEWTYGVHSTGVFCKTSSLPVTRNAPDAAQSACDYIPYLWSIADQNGKLYAPVITESNGMISIAEAEGGQSCTIYYTTDGADPDPNASVYTQPFAAVPGQTVKAISVYGGASAAYVVHSDIESYTVVDYFSMTDVSGSSNTLTLTKLSDGSAPAVSLEYSTDKRSWTAWSEENSARTLSIPAGGTVYLRGSNPSGFAVNDTNCHVFSSTGDISAGGDIMYLLNTSGGSSVPANGFRMLFSGMTTLRGTPKLTASTVATGGCRSMFHGCTGITSAAGIHLDDTAPGSYAYYYMFNGCSSLATPPAFTSSPVTLAGFAMAAMFRGTALTAAPAVNIAATGQQSLDSVFRECASLTDASSFGINAAALQKRTCYTMFRGCSSLSAAPEIMAATLYSASGDGSLAGIFNGCSSLPLVKTHFTSWDANMTQNWLNSVAASGVLCMTAASAAAVTMGDAGGCPSGWSLADENGKLYAPSFSYDRQNGTIAISEYRGGGACGIYYTTDGTTPTPQNGTLYTGAFAVTPGQTVKAISVYGGASAAYVVHSNIAAYTVEDAITYYGYVHASPLITPANPYYNRDYIIGTGILWDDPSIKVRVRAMTKGKEGGLLNVGHLGIPDSSAYDGSHFEDSKDIRLFAYQSGYYDFASGRVAGIGFTYTNGKIWDLTIGDYYVYDNIAGTYLTNQNQRTIAEPLAEIFVDVGTWWLNSLQIWRNDVLVFDGVAATDGVSTGLYDSISGTIKTRSGITIVGEPSTVVAPSVTREGANIVITQSGFGTTYYTTDGSTPTAASTQYTQPFASPAPGSVVKAVTIDGSSSSDVTSYTVTSTMLFAPNISRSENNVVIIQVNSPWQSASIYYTTDGSTPTAASTLYTGPIPAVLGQVVSAMCHSDNPLCTDSGTRTFTVRASQLSAPSLSRSENDVVITHSNESWKSVTIRYTTDGSTPTAESPAYTGAIPAVLGQTVKAICTSSLDLYTASGTASLTVTSVKMAAPVCGYANSLVTIRDNNPAYMGSSVYYTTDGSTPDSTSTLYTQPFAASVGDTVKAVCLTSNNLYTASDVISYTVSSGGLPQNTFMFNYNAKEYDQSSLTFPKTSGQLFDQDLVLNYSPSADHSSDGYVTMNGRSYMDVIFTRNSDNVFNRQNTAEGRTLTLVFKVAWTGAGGGEAAFLGNRGKSQSESGNTWNYMMRYNLFHVTNGPSIQAQGSSPLVFYVRVNSDATCIYKCATTGVYSETSGVSYGNPSGNFTFFGDSNFASSTSFHFQGSFYWMYLSHEALTDAEIQQVIDYNENL